MSIITKIPTVNESPDSSQIVGDVAVTSPTNTGHAQTICAISGIGSIIKTCRWSGFQNILAGLRTSVKLKVTHTSSAGFLNDGSNEFKLEYTVNSGGAWNVIVDRVNFTSNQGPTTTEVILPLSQDLSQVQVRDLIDVSGFNVGSEVDAFVTISDIKIEITVSDATFLD